MIPPAPTTTTPTPSPKPRDASAASFAGICLLTLLLPLLLPACEQPPKQPPVPTTGEGVFRERDPDGQDRRRPLIVAVHRLDLLLEDSAAEAWNLVDEDTFPPLTRTVWHANGLRPGMLAGRDLDRFANALPGLIRVSRSQLAPGDHHAVLLTAPKPPEPIIVDLTIPPRAVREVPIRSGRIQLLARLEALSPDGSADAGVRVELTPHQYVPQITLTPRDPFEQRLDGRVFKELTLRADVPPSRMLVVGLYRPEPPAAPEEDEQPDEPGEPAPAGDTRIAAAPPPPGEQAQPDDADAEAPDRGTGDDTNDEEDAQEEAEQAGPPPLPPNLGRALFTGRRMNRNVQTMLLISAEPGPPPEAAASSEADEEDR